ncbi:LOW QUALITY PROTEIN: hypothetical protein HZS_3631 [Henneguya salminicola]|nr:LOW QUALITY PROTEIN: hypothetical protein HZS_3631 [Henneguya salminicola]
MDKSSRANCKFASQKILKIISPLCDVLKILQNFCCKNRKQLRTGTNFALLFVKIQPIILI